MPSPEGLDLAEPGAIYEITDEPETKFVWEGFEDNDKEVEDDERIEIH